MSKKPKMVPCRHCHELISRNAKICPHCGAKNKKPFYLRLWFIILVVLVMFVAYISYQSTDHGEKLKWNDYVLSDMLPKPASLVGHLSTDSSDTLSVNIYNTSPKDYENYLDQCQSAGFTIDQTNDTTGYQAFNEAGYMLDLSYYEYSEKMDIRLDAPMELGTIAWPTSGPATLLPAPTSSVGNIQSNSSTSFSAYLGDTSLDTYRDYVESCKQQGFDVDFSEGDRFYSADNTEGYSLRLSYEGNQVMYLSISAPDSSQEPQTTPPTTQTPAPDTSENGELRADFKQAMDAYEAFIDEYVAFMQKYAASDGTDLSLLNDFTSYMNRYNEMASAFANWESEDLTDEELAYYLEVQTRVNQKLSGVSTNIAQ